MAAGTGCFAPDLLDPAARPVVPYLPSPSELSFGLSLRNKLAPFAAAEFSIPTVATTFLDALD